MTRNNKYFKIIHSHGGFDLVREVVNWNAKSYYQVFKDGEKFSSIYLTSVKSFIRVINTYLKTEKTEKPKIKVCKKVAQMAIVRPPAIYSNKNQ